MQQSIVFLYTDKNQILMKKVENLFYINNENIVELSQERVRIHI